MNDQNLLNQQIAPQVLEGDLYELRQYLANKLPAKQRENPLSQVTGYLGNSRIPDPERQIETNRIVDKILEEAPKLLAAKPRRQWLGTARRLTKAITNAPRSQITENCKSVLLKFFTKTPEPSPQECYDFLMRCNRFVIMNSDNWILDVALDVTDFERPLV